MRDRARQEAELSMAQVLADIKVADFCIQSAEKESLKMSKSLKGQAGYHLQQAAEKLIKIQIYASGKELDYSKLYKHGLDILIMYAETIGIKPVVPTYVSKHAYVISEWEARGRYDLHLAVRIDVLKKAYAEIKKWADELMKLGYK